MSQRDAPNRNDPDRDRRNMDLPIPPSEETSVQAAWDAHWRRRRLEARTLDLLTRIHVIPAGLKLAASIVERHAAPMAGKRVLDAGSGTGVASMLLARRGAQVTLLDASAQALRDARRRYAACSTAADFVEGSIFSLPFESSSFDVVWNTGLLEHFGCVDRKRALREMLRVTAPDGVVVTVNPSARARTYARLKRAAEDRGMWDVGFEDPIPSLADLIDPELHTLEEYSLGWLMQWHFAKYLLPRTLRLPYVALHEVAQRLVPFLNRRPGYLLVSVIAHRPT